MIVDARARSEAEYPDEAHASQGHPDFSALTRPLVAALIGTTLTALAAVFLSQSGAKEVRQHVEHITRNANPSIQHLLDVQQALATAERALYRVRTGEAEASAAALEAAGALDQADRAWELYKELPIFEGEGVLQTRVDGNLRRVRALTTRTLGLLQAGDRSGAQALLQTEMAETFRLLGDRLQNVIMFNLSEDHFAALSVGESQVRSRQIALLVGATALVLALAQMLLLGRAAVRLTRRQSAYMEAVTKERRELAERLRQSERLATLGQVLAEVSHELGTPLNVITGRADALIRRAAGDPEASAMLTVIAEQARRITRIVQQLLTNARQRRGAFVLVEPFAIARNVIDFLQPDLESQGHEVQLRGDANVRVRADPDLLQQVLLNLVQNAMQACVRDGRIQVLITANERDVALSVVDDGPGVPPEFVPRLFQPFATTKQAGKGTGLGLSICRTILRDLGGTLSYVPVEGRGSHFRAVLPLAAAAA